MTKQKALLCILARYPRTAADLVPLLAIDRHGVNSRLRTLKRHGWMRVTDWLRPDTSGGFIPVYGPTQAGLAHAGLPLTGQPDADAPQPTPLTRQQRDTAYRARLRRERRLAEAAREAKVRRVDGLIASLRSQPCDNVLWRGL